jgi:hypothetical protein
VTELEELMALLPRLSKEKVHELLVEVKLSVSMVPAGASGLGEFLGEMVATTEAGEGYTDEACSFRR